MLGAGVVGLEVPRIVGILIRKPEGRRRDHWLQGRKQLIPPFRSPILAGTVLPVGDPTQRTLGRHRGDLKIQYFSTLRFDRNRDAQGLALGMFARLEVIELDERQGRPRKILQEPHVLAPGLISQEPELPDHGFSVHPQQDGRAALRYSRGEQESERMVDLSLLLAIAGEPGSGGKGPAAAAATESGDSLTVGAPKVDSLPDD